MKKINFTLLLVSLFPMLVPAQSPHWIPQGQGILPDDYGIMDLSVVDENIVWALASNDFDEDGNLGGDPEYIIKSVDGGDSWEVHTLDALSDRNIGSLTAVNGDIAWLSVLDASGTPYFYQTINGGMDWVLRYTVSGTPNSIPYIKFIDDLRGYFVSSGNSRSGNTSNGGSSWSENDMFTFLSDESYLEAPAPNWLEVKGDTLWFGTNKRMARSIDGGTNWESIFPEFPGNNAITSIAFDDTGYGFAVSDNNLDFWPNDEWYLDYTVAWTSEDFGETWSLPSNINFPINGITYVPGEDKTFVAVSGVWQWFDPQIQLSWASVFTTDGGITWTEIDREIPYQCLGFASINAGWIGSIGDFDYGFAPGNKPAVFKWEGFPVDAKQTQVESEVALSPNPATDFLYLQLPEGITQPIEVSLFDPTGKLMGRQVATTGQAIDLQGLAPGMYWVKAVVGERVYTGKFSKF